MKYTERQIAQAAIYLAAVVSKARLAKQVRDHVAAVHTEVAAELLARYGLEAGTSLVDVPFAIVYELLDAAVPFDPTLEAP